MKGRLLFFLISLSSLLLGNEIFDISYLTNNDGLSNSSINIIYQDSNEIMWFGTWDGLNMYNGIEFKVFKPESGNPFSISNNIIRDIVEVEKGTLWIATDLGINRYSLREGLFRRYLIDSLRYDITNEHSFLIAADANGNLIASVYQQGLYYYSRGVDQFLPLNTGREFNIKNILFDDDNHLWVHTNEGELYRITFYNGSIFQGVNDIKELTALTNVSVLFLSKYPELIVQTVDNNIYRYNYVTDRVTQVMLDNLGIDDVLDIDWVDSYFYLGTKKGFYRYDDNFDDIDPIIENSPILSVHAGTQDILWVGTDMRGIIKIVQPKDKFVTYSPENMPELGLSAVRTFSEDQSGNMWVGTKGSGLYSFVMDKKTGLLQMKANYTVEHGLTSNSIYRIASGNNGVLWIGSDGNSINYIDSNQGRVKRLVFSDGLEGEINLSSIYAILADEDNTLWVGTSGYGMYKLDIDSSSDPFTIVNYKQYVYKDEANSISNNIVYSIIRDDSADLLIATRGGGINRFNTVSETFDVIRFSNDNPDYSSSDDVLCLFIDSNGTLWAGTSMGLYKVNYDESGIMQTVNYSERDGMPNNTIHGILQDQVGSLWVSTNSGLAKLSMVGDSVIITSYSAIDGLQDNEFSDGAYYVSPTSSLFYFGGIRGFNEFNPLSVVDENHIPNLLLDAFYADNREYNIADFFVEKNGKEELVMPYDIKSFSFHFTNVDYLTGEKCEISYFLEGYHSDWVNIGRSNTIVFSNLPKGNYSLKVRNRNAYGVWSESSFTLPLKVKPPWWETKLAYVIYILLIVIIAYASWKALNYRLRVRKSEEIHQAKLSFFTNIAHEFSNSLTLIYSPCEKLLLERPADSMIKKYVPIIKSNSERMQTLIQQLVEFRTADSGHLKLNFEYVDIQELIRYILDNFLDMLEEKKIHCKIISDPESIKWATDRDSVEKILFNMISNAVKYTPQNEKIDIVTQIKDEMLQVCVTNTGIGIKEEFRERIFDRFEVLNRFEKQVSFTMQSRHGIGLAICKSLAEVLNGQISVESDGETFTSFILQLPSAPITEAASIVTHNMVNCEDESLNNHMDDSESERAMILVVEDDTQIRQLIVEMFEDKYDIIEAADGKEAVEMTNKYLPHLIISDIIMPVMNGVEFVKAIRSSNLTRHIPVIYLTSKNDIESQIEGFESGVDAYLSKPFNFRHLEVLIESLLGRTKIIREYSDSPASAMEHFEGKLMHKEDKEFLICINKILHDNIENENLSIEFIASEVAISKMQLYRKIKAITDSTPTEYIRSVRLNYAEKLLKTTNKTVQEIMFLSGFNNKAYFYRLFTKKHNKTPVEYRNSAE